MDLAYRPFVLVDDLRPGQCTVHHAHDDAGARWWLLWMLVPRDDRPAYSAPLRGAPPMRLHGSLENDRKWVAQ
jgi:hypothetical protein